jgi:hypothetical protein
VVYSRVNFSFRLFQQLGGLKIASVRVLDQVLVRNT